MTSSFELDKQHTQLELPPLHSMQHLRHKHSHTALIYIIFSAKQWLVCKFLVFVDYSTNVLGLPATLTENSAKDLSKGNLERPHASVGRERQSGCTVNKKVQW